MAKATVEMVKRKDPKAVPQKKGEALDAQYSKVQYARVSESFCAECVAGSAFYMTSTTRLNALSYTGPDLVGYQWSS